MFYFTCIIWESIILNWNGSATIPIVMMICIIYNVFPKFNNSLFLFFLSLFGGITRVPREIGCFKRVLRDYNIIIFLVVIYLRHIFKVINVLLTQDGCSSSHNPISTSTILVRVFVVISWKAPYRRLFLLWAILLLPNYTPLFCSGDIEAVNGTHREQIIDLFNIVLGRGLYYSIQIQFLCQF